MQRLRRWPEGNINVLMWNFTKLIILRSEVWSDWPAIKYVVAEYPKRETEMLHPLPYCYAVSRHDDTKTIKSLINEAVVASSGNIITDYNITMSVFVNGEMTNNKHYSTQLKTRVWIVSSRNVLTDCMSKASDCPCKVGIAPLYRNSLCAGQHCRLLFQVQEIVLRKMRCTHSNICVELFWNRVVNTT